MTGKSTPGNALIVVRAEPIWDSSLPDKISIDGLFYDLETAMAHVPDFSMWEFDVDEMRWNGRGGMGRCWIISVGVDATQLKDIVNGET
jgi:hypothetical protein